ncbi:hypothetical protein EDB84DRAFT_1567898 [Lactarius hengduanensis]|nr:hypothetical protein EDB84DRAFT_1567898 [Lactarius hengduanensis]
MSPSPVLLLSILYPHSGAAIGAQTCPPSLCRHYAQSARSLACAPAQLILSDLTLALVIPPPVLKPRLSSAFKKASQASPQLTQAAAEPHGTL